MEGEYPLNLELVENFNLRLGDIYEIMELYKKYVAKSQRKFFIVYFFKVLYSLELVELLLEAYLYNTEQEESPSELRDEYGLTDNVYLLNYQQLINTSFMPDNLNYIDYNRAKAEKDYTFKNSIDDMTVERFVIDNFITSSIASKGDIKMATKTDLSGYRYRKLYNFNKIDFLSLNSSYTIEFFVPFIKTAHISKALLNYQKKDKNQVKDNEMDKFLLYSMFQIDNFVRKVYSTNSKTNKYYFVIQRIQDIFGEINNTFYKLEQSKDEVDIIDILENEVYFEVINRNYFLPIFNNGKINYEIPYEVEDDLIKEYLQSINPDLKSEHYDERSFYSALFDNLFSKQKQSRKKNNIVFEESEFYVLTDGKEFSQTIYFPDEKIEIAKQKNSIKNMVSKIREHEDKLTPQVRSLLDDIDKAYLNPDAKTSIANHRVTGLILSLFRQLEK